MWNSWAEYLNVPEDFDVSDSEETYPAESSIPFPIEDANVFGPHSLWNDLFLVICKVCGNTVRSQILRTHMEQKHRMKVLQPHHSNHVPVQVAESAQNPSQDTAHDKRMDDPEERLPGTSSKTNSSNYNLKYCRENTDARLQIRKRKLIVKLRKKLL